MDDCLLFVKMENVKESFDCVSSRNIIVSEKYFYHKSTLDFTKRKYFLLIVSKLMLWLRMIVSEQWRKIFTGNILYNGSSQTGARFCQSIVATSINLNKTL